MMQWSNYLVVCWNRVMSRNNMGVMMSIVMWCNIMCVMALSVM